MEGWSEVRLNFFISMALEYPVPVSVRGAERQESECASRYETWGACQRMSLEIEKNRRLAMLLASLVGIACWTPPHVSLPQAASAIRMTASSSIDSGTRLETSQTLKEMKGVVEPTGSVTSWFDAGIRLRQPTKAELLQRYLQLRDVLNEAPLPDAAVEALIEQVEQEAAPAIFDKDRILGEWQLCWQQNAKEATKSQKALAPLPQYSNFITDDNGKNVFRNIVQVTKSRVKVVADVEYSTPTGEQPSRLGSTICAASLELAIGRRFGWKPLKIPLPLRGVGWLDVNFLSDDMRITRGNRGGLFVHLRPRLLTREEAEATKL